MAAFGALAGFPLASFPLTGPALAGFAASAALADYAPLRALDGSFPGSRGLAALPSPPASTGSSSEIAGAQALLPVFDALCQILRYFLDCGKEVLLVVDLCFQLSEFFGIGLLGYTDH